VISDAAPWRARRLRSRSKAPFDRTDFREHVGNAVRVVGID
jgi:hypothetical protein